MNRKEYKEILDYELYRGKKLSFFNRFRIKHLQPNTNCTYLARKMWYLYSKGGVMRKLSKLYYLRILRKFGCIIYASIEVGKGFHVAHPVGIVLGRCTIGENFTVFQNCTVGIKNYGDEQNNLRPVIGNNVRMLAGSMVFGNVSIADDVTIGANSVVLKTITEPGVYVGSPCHRVK